jgi:hypothetical protein
LALRPSGNLVPVRDRPILLKTKVLSYIMSCGLINTDVGKERGLLTSDSNSILLLNCWTTRMKFHPSKFGNYIAIYIAIFKNTLIFSNTSITTSNLASIFFSVTRICLRIYSCSKSCSTVTSRCLNCPPLRFFSKLPVWQPLLSFLA